MWSPGKIPRKLVVVVSEAKQELLFEENNSLVPITSNPGFACAEFPLLCPHRGLPSQLSCLIWFTSPQCSIPQVSKGTKDRVLVIFLLIFSLFKIVAQLQLSRLSPDYSPSPTRPHLPHSILPTHPVVFGISAD